MKVETAGRPGWVAGQLNQWQRGILQLAFEAGVVRE